MRYAIDPSVSVYQQVPMGHPVRPMPAAAGTALYRLYDAAGALLYVGVSSRPRDRWYNHSRRADWWPQVAIAEVSEWRLPEYHARMAETHAINEERPRHNRAKVAPIPEGSRRTQGAITDPSLTTPIGKGREGKGSGKGRVDLALATHLKTAPEGFGGACRYAESRWTR